MRPGNESPISEVIREMLRKYELEDGLWNVRIHEAWAKCIAAPVLQRTVKIHFNNGSLKVTLNSSVVRNELELMKNEIIQSLNKELDAQVVNEVSFF
ncbi:MAG: DUF721 domain-containing protein [Bacteroidia bacterium]|nr:DUF721 domain-containing protein [Bacteroidia bacterium]